MAKTKAQRMKVWRTNKAKSGGRTLSIMLSPETALLFKSLKSQYGDSNPALIARALEALSSTSRQEVVTCKPDSTLTGEGIHPLLAEIKKQIDRGIPIADLKTDIKSALKEMKSQGLGSAEIARALHDANIPTLKGNAEWKPGTIRKMWS